MREFGYALKLVNDENLVSEITHYFSLYNILEIKLKDKQKDNIDLSNFINALMELQGDKISYHIEPNMIKEFEFYREYLYKLVANYKMSKYVITHMPVNKCFNIKIIYRILEILPQESILLLENELFDYDFFEKFVLFYSELEEASKERIGICLDFGHFDKFKILENKIDKFAYLDKVYECHLHSPTPFQHSRFDINDDSTTSILRVLKKLPNVNRCILELKDINVLDYEGEEQVGLFSDKRNEGENTKWL